MGNSGNKTINYSTHKSNYMNAQVFSVKCGLMKCCEKENNFIMVWMVLCVSDDGKLTL